MTRLSAAAVLLAACAGGEDTGEHLSDLGLFEYAGDGQFEYAEGVVPYDLNTPLFSDHALKDRAIRIPDGEAATWSDDGTFEFPVGTVLIKSFSFPADLRYPDEDRRIVETRLLVRGEDGWEGEPYVWDEDETDAVREVGGRSIDVSLVDADGRALAFAYAVPQRNQCVQCHEIVDEGGGRRTTPIGTKARHLARDNVYDGVTADQLEHLAALGMLEGLPGVVPAAFDFREVLDRGVSGLTSEEAERAARDWLDINCAHCHSPTASVGITTQLFLQHDEDDAFHLGVCKLPGSAGPGGEGRTWDVVPGDHEASILWFRMTTTEGGGAMMPMIGRATTYAPASDLVARWIDEMPGGPCDSASTPGAQGGGG